MTACQATFALYRIAYRDLGELEDLEECVFGDAAWSEPELRQQLTQHALSWLARDSTTKKVIGYVCWHICVDNACRQTALVRLAVHPDYRRQGVATALLQPVLFRTAVSDGCSLLAVLPETSLAAQRCLFQAGFRATGVIPQFFADDIDGYEFRYAKDVS